MNRTGNVPAAQLSIFLVFLMITCTVHVAVAAGVDLANLPVSQGVKYFGNRPNSGANGRLVTPVGDFNGDGYEDFVVGSPLSRLTTTEAAGAAYFVLGKQSGFGDVDLTTFATGNSNGFQITVTQSSGVLGMWVASAGDYNDDGYDDFLIGTWDYNVYVVLGSATNLTNLNVSTFDASNNRGFKISGGGGGLSGFTIDGIGDFNNDGKDDLLLGAPNVQGRYYWNFGRAYVLLGRTAVGNINLTSFVASDEAGFSIGGEYNSELGKHVTAAGDMNGDSYADFYVGVANRVSTGTYQTEDYRYGPGYIVLGKASGLTDVDLDQSGPASNFVLVHSPHSQVGRPSSGYPAPIACAGDINGDGYSDMVMGAPTMTYDAQPATGAAYVLFGRPDMSGYISMADIGGANRDGVRINGDVNASLGSAVSAGGDINGDGLDDLLVVAHNVTQKSTTSSLTYAIFGNRDLSGTTHVSEIGDGTRGFVVNGSTIPTWRGPIPASAGDVNNDGYSDMIIHYITRGDRADIGSTYLVFGKPTLETAVEAWSLY